MSADKCRMTAAIARTFPRELDEPLHRHLRGCAQCQAEWEALTQLRSLALALPTEQPDAERRDAVRARLLYQAERLRQQLETEPPARPAAGLGRRLGWAVAAAALLLLGLWGIRAQQRQPGANPSLVAHGSAANTGSVGGTIPPAALPAIEAWVDGQGQARFHREQQATIEVVQLHHGTVQVRVQPLPPGARFIVRVGESEVEVRGTLFTVTAENDRLQRVAVMHGLVEVRAARQPTTLLAAGQSWQAAEPARASQPEPVGSPSEARLTPRAAAVVESRPARRLRGEATISAAPPRAAAQPLTAPAPSTAPAKSAAPLAVAPVASAARTIETKTKEPEPEAALVSPAEKAFLAGFAALKQGRFVSAASDLDRAIALSPEGAIAEDARFWSGVAWARAGRSREAMASLRAFLAQHPRSTRQPEVAAALGWMLIRERKLDEAERVVRSAGAQRTPEVAESLRTAQAAISAARAQP